MGKPALTKDDLPFVYQLGQDVAKLGNEIDKLKNKPVKAVRIVVPATPDEYQQYGLRAVINLPEECQHAICIKSKRGQVDLVETGETLSVYTEPNTSEFYLAPIYKLEAETINATLDQEQIEQIESNMRQERERQERERQERDYRENYVYYALVKYAKDKYARELALKNELDDIKLVPNWMGLNEFLYHPFLRVENGVVNSDNDYLANTKDIINDLKTQASKFENEKRDIENGSKQLDLSKLEKPEEYTFNNL